MATLKKDEVPVDVTWQDQQRICTFSRVHRRLQHLQKRLKNFTDDIEKMDDASTEIMVVDDALLEDNADACDDTCGNITVSRIKFVFGEAFVDVDADRCGELLDAEKERLEEEKAEVEAEVQELEATLEELKAQLYAKFGSQIYLEDK